MITVITDINTGTQYDWDIHERLLLGMRFIEKFAIIDPFFTYFQPVIVQENQTIATEE